MPLPYASHRCLITARRSLEQAANSLTEAIDQYKRSSPAFQSLSDNRGDFEQLVDAQAEIQQARIELLYLCRPDGVAAESRSS